MENRKPSDPAGGTVSRRSAIRSGAAVLGASLLGPAFPVRGTAAQAHRVPTTPRPTGRRGAASDLIRAENEKPGTTDWILTKVRRHADEPYEKGWHRRKEIEAYVSHLSIHPGETLDLFVSADPPDEYMIQIFRMGYYGGKGGRLVETISPMRGLAPATAQPTPADGPNHVISCRWEPSYRLQIPRDWVSGVYLGKLGTWRSSDSEAYFIFVVRDDRPADLLFQVSDFTWAAYNRWPQWRSLYDTPSSPWGADAPDSYDAGFDRPYGLYWNGYPAAFEPLTNGSGEFLMTEYPLAYWLEREGYDVTYVSNLDAHVDGPGLLRARVFLSVGHDEYWTREMFDNLSNARNAGVNLAFLSGNAISGRVELVPGADGRPHRGLHLVERFTEEVDLMGSRSYGVGLGDWTCAAPDHWAFAGTGMKQGDHIPNLVGWEFHGPPLTTRFKERIVLAEGPVRSYQGKPEPESHAATLYTAEKGNYVFNAGTCWWCKPLAAPPAYINPPYLDFSGGDERVRRITKNILDRMIAVEAG